MENAGLKKTQGVLCHGTHQSLWWLMYHCDSPGRVESVGLSKLTWLELFFPGKIAPQFYRQGNKAQRGEAVTLGPHSKCF